MLFRDPISGSVVENTEVPNFLNEFFANISVRVCDQGSANLVQVVLMELIQ